MFGRGRFLITGRLSLNRRQRLSLFDVLVGFAVGAAVFSLPSPIHFYLSAAFLSFLLSMYNRKWLIAQMGRLPLIGYRRRKAGTERGRAKRGAK